MTVTNPKHLLKASMSARSFSFEDKDTEFVKCNPLNRGVFHFKKEVHYPEEIKCGVVEIKKDGASDMKYILLIGV